MHTLAFFNAWCVSHTKMKRWCRLIVNRNFPLKSYHQNVSQQNYNTTCCQAKQRPKKKKWHNDEKKLNEWRHMCIQSCQLVLNSVSFAWFAVLRHAVFAFGVFSNPQCTPDKPRCRFFVQTSCFFLICDLLYPVHVGSDSLLWIVKLGGFDYISQMLLIKS